jgi:hypothetical protein
LSPAHVADANAETASASVVSASAASGVVRIKYTVNAISADLPVNIGEQISLDK